MAKKFGRLVISVLPKGAQEAILNAYWRTKSTLLYSYLYKKLDLEYGLSSGIHLQVASRGEWWAYNEIFVEGEYDRAIFDALSARKPEGPFHVLDLGANVGFFTLRVLDLVRRNAPTVPLRMALVEGNPNTCAELRRRMERQPAQPAELCVLDGLVGNRSGATHLRVRRAREEQHLRRIRGLGRGAFCRRGKRRAGLAGS